MRDEWEWVITFFIVITLVVTAIYTGYMVGRDIEHAEEREIIIVEKCFKNRKI